MSAATPPDAASGVRTPSGTAWRVAACVAAAAATWALVPAEGPPREGLALFVLIGALWVTQALHLTVTALLVPVIAVLAGLTDVPSALRSFAHPTVFLFLGGFALAAAFQQQGLDRRAAVALIRVAGGRRLGGVLALFAMTAALSMWMSNSATAAMMLPLAAGLLREAPTGAPADGAGPAERAFVMLGLAYSASLGGIGTLVGSPPNAIAAAQAGIGFAQWLAIGLPMVLLLLPVMVTVLALMLRPRLAGSLPTPSAPAAAPGGFTRAQRATIAVFAVTVAGWIWGAPLARAVGVQGEPDALVAIAAVVALVTTGAIDWKGIESRTQWGVLLLFGGGLALSDVMGASGASRYLVDGLMTAAAGVAPWMLLLAMLLFVVFLTELISNTAAAALLVPVAIGLAGTLGLSPAQSAATIAIASSCGFMLPMGTPPNALVYGTGQVPMSTMMRCGLVLNLLCVAVMFGWARLAG